MTLLVAQEFAPGRFSKVALLKRTRNGWNFPAKLHGTIWTYAAKTAASQFDAEPAARTVFFEFGSTKCRVDLIS